MPLSINTRSYTVDTPSANSVIYRDPNATFQAPSTAKLGRINAKPNGDYAGNTKSEAKVARTPLVGGRYVPALIRAESSVPVGTPDADLDLMIADFRSLVASTAFVDLVKNGKIYYA